MKIKSFLFDNMAVKISALALAVILWLFVTSKGQTEISLNVPVEYTNLPSGIDISHNMVKSVNIVLRGHESILKNMKQENLRLSLDMSKAKKGEAVFPVRNDDIKLPAAVSIINIEPRAVKIFFEETASKKVAIKPAITGTPDDSFYVRSVDVRPAETMVEGAKSEVRRIGSLKTEPIDITGIAEDMDQEVALNITGVNARVKTEKIIVHIRLGKKGR